MPGRRTAASNFKTVAGERDFSIGPKPHPTCILPSVRGGLFKKGLTQRSLYKGGNKIGSSVTLAGPCPAL